MTSTIVLKASDCTKYGFSIVESNRGMLSLRDCENIEECSSSEGFWRLTFQKSYGVASYGIASTSEMLELLRPAMRPSYNPTEFRTYMEKNEFLDPILGDEKEQECFDNSADLAVIDTIQGGHVCFTEGNNYFFKPFSGIILDLTGCQSGDELLTRFGIYRKLLHLQSEYDIGVKDDTSVEKLPTDQSLLDLETISESALREAKKDTYQAYTNSTPLGKRFRDNLPMLHNAKKSGKLGSQRPVDLEGAGGEGKDDMELD